MPSFIRDLYCYCDQCCERCPLTGRCAVFAGSAALDEARLEPDNQQFWTGLLEQFYMSHPDFPRDAVESIEVRPVSEAELEALQREQDALAARLEQEPAWQAFQAYRAALYALLEDTAYWRGLARSRASQAAMGLFSPQGAMAEAGRVTDCLHELRRQCDVGEERLRSALSMRTQPTSERPLSPDGLAKVVLLGFGHARPALQDLYGIFGDEDRLLPLFTLMASALQAVEAQFPDARSFVRPGLDEECVAIIA